MSELKTLGEKLASDIWAKKIQPMSFDPDVMAIDTRPLPKMFVLSYLLLVLGLVSTIAWLVFARLDKVVVLEGHIHSRLANQVVRPFNASVLKNLNVQPGQKVLTGDVIASFESNQSQADANAAESATAALRKDIARFENEYRLYKSFPEIPSVETSDQSFQSKVAELKLLSQKVKTSSAFSKRQNDTYREQIELIKDQKARADLDLAKRVELRKKRLTTDKEVLTASDKSSALQAQFLEINNQIKALERQVELEQQELNNFVAAQLVKNRSRIVELQNELQQRLSAFQKAAYIRELDIQKVVRSGIVLSVTTKSAGSTVMQNDIIAEIAPEANNDELQIFAKVKSQDAGWVVVNQFARFKLESLPYVKHGSIKGKVKSVNQLPDSSNGSTLVQQIIIGIEDYNLKALPDGFQLIPNMTGRVEVLIGTVPAYEYLLGPLFDGLSKAGQEAR
jgi:hemolysin D